MGEARQARRLSDAARGHPVGRLVARFALDERGATALEYGLIAGLIAAVIIVALTAVSGSIQNNMYNKVQTSLGG